MNLHEPAPPTKRILTTGRIPRGSRLQPVTITAAQLVALVDEADVGPSCYGDTTLAWAVLDHFGVDVDGDGAPDGGPTRADREVAQLAYVVVRLADMVQQALEATEGAPSVTLEAALAELAMVQQAYGLGLAR